VLTEYMEANKVSLIYGTALRGMDSMMYGEKSDTPLTVTPSLPGKGKRKKRPNKPRKRWKK